MAEAQPMPTISAAAMGAVANWPKEPPALTMPVAMPRRAGSIMRTLADISTAGPAMPEPPDASTPIAKIRPSVLVMKGVMNVPIASRTTPAISTRAAP
jgi:hypothetical protein